MGRFSDFMVVDLFLEELIFSLKQIALSVLQRPKYPIRTAAHHNFV